MCVFHDDEHPYVFPFAKAGVDFQGSYAFWQASSTYPPKKKKIQASRQFSKKWFFLDLKNEPFEFFLLHKRLREREFDVKMPHKLSNKIRHLPICSHGSIQKNAFLTFQPYMLSHINWQIGNSNKHITCVEK